MKIILFGLLFMLPLIGMSQAIESLPTITVTEFRNLTPKLMTGRTRWTMGSVVRHYVWVKIDKKIKYYQIDDLQVITLNQAIKILIENEWRKENLFQSLHGQT